jgi:hypothetical protein
MTYDQPSGGQPWPQQGQPYNPQQPYPLQAQYPPPGYAPQPQYPPGYRRRATASGSRSRAATRS